MESWKARFGGVNPQQIEQCPLFLSTEKGPGNLLTGALVSARVRIQKLGSDSPFEIGVGIAIGIDSSRTECDQDLDVNWAMITANGTDQSTVLAVVDVVSCRLV